MSFDIPFSSYWTWLILGTLVLVTQLLGVSEKLWIKVGPLNLRVTWSLTLNLHRLGEKHTKEILHPHFMPSVRLPRRIMRSQWMASYCIFNTNTSIMHMEQSLMSSAVAGQVQQNAPFSTLQFMPPSELQVR
jgi:hypothetical protein